MKKFLAIALTIMAFTASMESKANLMITNTQPCAYTVYVFEAVAPGTCMLTAQYIPVAVPPGPGTVVPYACPPGMWVVGVCIEETFPVPMLPPMVACVGLSNPALPAPCAGFPAMSPPIGSCGAVAAFVTGVPLSTLVI